MNPKWYVPIYLMIGGGFNVPESSFTNYSAKKYSRSHIWALKLTSFDAIIHKNDVTKY
jgi:hypothetical protein